MARLKERYQKEIAPAIAKEFGIKNRMAIPRLNKIVLNMGMGEAIANAKVLDTAVEELKSIAGQKPVITRAKDYILEHQAEDLSLGQVAKAVNTSTFYFCKLFKKVTGINFTDYLSRVRIEKAKNLLLNPNLRISEIAYEVGFQSLTHFNRVFKKIIGQSPTRYRGQLARA